MMDYKKAWTHSDVADLISMYRSMHCLWEVNSPDYKDRNKRNHCLEAMAVKFNTTPSEITRKIHNLRSQFHSERQKLLQRKSLYGSHHRCISKWPHFDSLRFLKKSITKCLRAEYKEVREPGNDPNYSENIENLGGGTAEPTSTVNVKQEPVDITESEQEMHLSVDNEINSRMEAHSSRTEHSNKSDPQSSKAEAHCSKMEMHYTSHGICKPETCCNVAESHYSRLEPYYGKTEVQCGLSDIHNNRSEIHNRPEIHSNRTEIHNRGEIHNSRSELHNNRSEINLPEPHSNRTDVRCSRTEPFCLLKIEPHAERVTRRNDHSENSAFISPEVRRLPPPGRNDIRMPHCRHRSESISSTHLDPPCFSSINDVPHNGHKRENQWMEEDQYEIFGKYVASELRSLNSDYLRRKLKRKIQSAVLDVFEEEEHHH